MKSMIKTIPCKESKRGQRSKYGVFFNELSSEEETLISNIKKYGKWNGTQGISIDELYCITYDRYAYKDNQYIIYELAYRHEGLTVIEMGVKQDEKV